MKHLITCLFILTTLLHCSAKEEKRLIPFDDFYFSVTTQKAEDGHKFRFALQLQRNKNIGGGICVITVMNPNFPHDQRRFEMSEIKAIINGGKALLAKKKFRKEIITDTYRGKLKTVFEVIDQPDGERLLTIKRDENIVSMHAGDMHFFTKALTEAECAKRWYEKIIVAEKKPKEIPTAKPPKAASYSFDMSLGTVKSGNLGYDVSLELDSYDGKQSQFEKMYGVTFKTKGNNSGGIHSNELSIIKDQMDLAAEAIKNNKEYLYRSDEENSFEDFIVAANLKTKKIEVSFDIGESFEIKGTVTGAFDIAQLKQIHANVKKYDVRRKWLEKNIGLFVK